VEEISNIHIVAIASFVVAFVFGVVGNKTQYCTMGAIGDWVNFQNRGRFAAWVLAMALAILGTQLLEIFDLVAVDESRFRGSSFAWLGYVLGGLLFGAGMTLTGGCGQRTLVRLGNGSLKSLFVFLVMGISAYMTIRGLFGALRVEYIEPYAIDLSERGIGDQGIPQLVAHLTGMSSSIWLPVVVMLAIVAFMLWWALRQPGLRDNAHNMLAGITIGVCIVAGWAITGWLGLDDFDPIPVESFSFIAPSGNSLIYLMTYTGATINFGIAIVAGVVLGSFVYGLIARKLRLEAFAQSQDMLEHFIGAVLMGVGGVLALGCTIGQGVTGISSLALGSFVATAAIMFGCAVTLRAQYHRLDDMSWFKALATGIVDVVTVRRDD